MQFKITYRKFHVQLVIKCTFVLSNRYVRKQKSTKIVKILKGKKKSPTVNINRIHPKYHT